MSRCHLSTEILTWANEWHNNIHPTLSTTKQKLCQTYAKMTNTCHVVPVSTRNWNHGTDNIRFGMLQLDESNPHIKTAFVSPSSASVWLRHIAPTRLAWMEWPRGGLAQFHMLCALLTFLRLMQTVNRPRALFGSGERLMLLLWGFVVGGIPQQFCRESRLTQP